MPIYRYQKFSKFLRNQEIIERYNEVNGFKINLDIAYQILREVNEDVNTSIVLDLHCQSQTNSKHIV